MRMREAGSANYVYAVTGVKVLPPVRPAVILNAGANYPAHAQGIIQQNARAARRRGGAVRPREPARRGPRPSVRAGPLGASRGRYAPRQPVSVSQIPECRRRRERRCRDPQGPRSNRLGMRVRAWWWAHPRRTFDREMPANYIFGYSIEFDVSDRGGRNDRKMGGGPGLVRAEEPRHLRADRPVHRAQGVPAQPMNTRHYFTLNGETQAGRQHQPDGIQHLGNAVLRVERDDALPGHVVAWARRRERTSTCRPRALDEGGGCRRVRGRWRRRAAT